MDLSAVERCPVEVLDHIIDYLHDDIPSLASCSLVCRNWTPSTHCHLFRSIRIAGGGPARLDAFSQFLSSTPYVALHVKELHIRAGDGPAAISTSTLNPILKRLNRLCVLDIRCSYCQFDDDALPTLLSLRKLVMQFVEVDITPTKFMSTLAHCPRLKELDIRKSWWAPSLILHEDSTAPVVPFLEGLTLGNCRLSSLTNHLEVLRSRIPMTTLTSLDIVCIAPGDVGVVGGLLRDVGSKLLHLRLRMGSLLLQGTTPENTFHKLAVTHCTSLRSFSVLASSYGAVYTLLRLVFLLLQSLASLTISRISIGFVTMSDDGGCRLLQAILAALPWAEAEHAMVGYPSLKEVAFTLERDLVLDGPSVPLDEKTKDIVLKQFPALRKRGILKVL